MKKNIDYARLLGEGNLLLRFDRLRESAMDEFSNKPFGDASLNDIIKNAGISKGSLYHHFGDKFGLYLCVIDIIIKKKLEIFSSVMEEKQYSGDFFGMIKQFIKATMELLIVDDRLYHFFNRVVDEGDSMKNKLMKFYPYDFNSAFRPLINSAIASGKIRGNFPAEFIVKAFEILFSNIHKFLTTKRSREEILTTINLIVELIQKGIS